MARTPTGQVIPTRGARQGWALRFRAYGKRRYLTLYADEGWTEQRARDELDYILAQVKRGVWAPPGPQPDGPAEQRLAPTFRQLSAERLVMRKAEFSDRDVEYWEWALSHLLPHVGTSRVSEITSGDVDRYRAAKLRERVEGSLDRPLSNNSINKTLQVLAQILDVAVDDGHLDTNPARGKRRRCKSEEPKRTGLEPEQVLPFLDAAAAIGAEQHARVTLGIYAGLRPSEASDLRWRDVADLAGQHPRVYVRDSKTPTGIRTVDLRPTLAEQLREHRARAVHDVDSVDELADRYVFPAVTGARRDRHYVNKLTKKVAAIANERLAKAGLPTIPGDVTAYSLRRTFAHLAYLAGDGPDYVMDQMGHKDARMALEVYRRYLARRHAREYDLDALVPGFQWAAMGSSTPTQAIEPGAASPARPAVSAP